MMRNKNKVVVIGAGLAGCECAYVLSSHGIDVELFEMKSKKFTPAHSNPHFAEIVCSNSLKSEDKDSSSGLLKAELEELGSIIIEAAKATRVPAGSALAVDREKFSEYVDNKIRSCKNIKIHCKEVLDIPTDCITVVATGPLTSEPLAKSISKLIGSENLYFYDASAPIVVGDTIDKEKTFVQNRYGEDNIGDYLNCPMNKDEYITFYNELVNAKLTTLHDFEKNEVFDGCMPIEIMAKREVNALRFGPLKPAGLYDKKNEQRPYAVVQLRKENVEAELYNLVGFQTNLTFGEQKRVFSLIPALNHAEFIKYGVMHKNTFICAPYHLDNNYRLKQNNNIYIAGQLSGVEGYIESTASGHVAALSIIATLGKKTLNLSSKTMIGAIANYISNPLNIKNFQPMNSNYGIISPLDKQMNDKKQARLAMFDRSIAEIKQLKEYLK